MSEEIKTLKDLDEEWIKNFETESMHQPGGGLSNKEHRIWFRDGHKVAHEYTIKEIKAEAIKWVKFCREPVPLEEWSVKSLLEFWMDRLNITEEDVNPSLCETEEVCEWDVECGKNGHLCSYHKEFSKKSKSETEDEDGN